MLTPLQKKHVSQLAAFAVLLLLPVFMLGAGGNDLHCQSLWVNAFSKQFLSGNLYPRWLMDIYAGNGSPVFFYYPPFAYYITAFFYAVLPHGEFAYIPIAASSLLAVFISGIAFYLWIKEEVTQEQAFWGSLFYMAAPAHLGFDFYQILLYSTMWAYAWLPLMLLFARAIARNKRYGVYGFALALCAMIITNIPGTVIAGPLAVLYGAVLCKKEDRKAAAIKGVVAMLLGFALSAFYLLPSLAYLNYSMVNMHWAQMNNDAREYILGFGSQNAAQYVHTLLWLLQAAIIGLCYFMKRDMPKFWLYAAVFAFILNTPVSEWLWSNVFLLKLLQNPLRLFILSGICIAVVASSLKNQHVKLALLCCCVGFIFYMAATTRTTPETFMRTNPDGYARYSLGIDQYANYLGYPELIRRYYDKKNIEALKNNHDSFIAEGDASFAMTRWEPRHIAFDYTARAASRIQIHQTFFPGWQAMLEGQPLETSWDEPTGQISVHLPAGGGKVVLTLERLWPEMAGRLLSLVAISGMMLAYLLAVRRNEQKV